MVIHGLFSVVQWICLRMGTGKCVCMDFGMRGGDLEMHDFKFFSLLCVVIFTFGKGLHGKKMLKMNKLVGVLKAGMDIPL